MRPVPILSLLPAHRLAPSNLGTSIFLCSHICFPPNQGGSFSGSLDELGTKLPSVVQSQLIPGHSPQEEPRRTRLMVRLSSSIVEDVSRAENSLALCISLSLGPRPGQLCGLSPLPYSPRNRLLSQSPWNYQAEPRCEVLTSTSLHLGF